MRSSVIYSKFYSSIQAKSLIQPQSSIIFQFVNHSRKFSSFSKVQGSSILISNHTPPKLRIPINDKVEYDFTLLDNETVKQFEEKVIENVKDSGLKLIRLSSVDNKRDENQPLADLMKSKFYLEVNKQKYDVYPHLENMIERPDKQNQDLIGEVFETHSIPIARRVILYHYLNQILNQIRKAGQKLNEDQLRQVLQKGLEQYSKVYTEKIFQNPLNQLKQSQEEYTKVQQQYQVLIKQAENFANLMLWGGFTMAAAQLIGMGSLIFVIHSWEVMEPITYLVSAFYATVGTGFYIWLRHDFDFKNSYEAFKMRRLRKLMKNTNFDSQKLEFLEDYTKTLESQIKILKNKDMDSISKEHIISGIIGGVASLALSAIACKLMRGCCGESLKCGMTKAKVITMTSQKLAQPIGPYTAGKKIECCGQNLAYSAGSIGLTQIGDLAGDDVESQTRQALNNLKALAEDNGFEMKHIIKNTLYLVDMAHFAKVNEIYKEYFPSDFPARTCVAVVGLPKGAKFEIESVFFRT